MGMMDEMKDKVSAMTDSVKARFNELKDLEQSGQLDDKAREELQQLRDRFGMK